MWVLRPDSWTLSPILTPSWGSGRVGAGPRNLHLKRQPQGTLHHTWEHLCPSLAVWGILVNPPIPPLNLHVHLPSSSAAQQGALLLPSYIKMVRGGAAGVQTPEIIYLSSGRAGGPFFYLFKSKCTKELKETEWRGPNSLGCAHWKDAEAEGGRESLGSSHFACKWEEYGLQAVVLGHCHRSNHSSIFSAATPTSQDSLIAEKSLPNFPGRPYEHPSQVSVQGKQKAQWKTLTQLSQTDMDTLPWVSLSYSRSSPSFYLSPNAEGDYLNGVTDLPEKKCAMILLTL